MVHPFELLVPGRTPAQVSEALAAAPGSIWQPGVRIKVHADGGVTARVPGGRFQATPKLRAQVVPDDKGARLAGTLNFGALAVQRWAYVIGALFMLGISVVVFRADGAANPAFWICLVGGVLLSVLGSSSCWRQAGFVGATPRICATNWSR